MRVVAIDPGPVLGICTAEDVPLQVGIRMDAMTLGQFALWLDRMPPVDLIIFERFMFYKDQARDYIDYSPAEYNGVIKAYCEVNSVKYAEQNASMAVGKSAFWGDSKAGNDRLRTIGLWDRKLAPHGMDALRHYLYWATFTKGDKRWLMRLKQS